MEGEKSRLGEVRSAVQSHTMSKAAEARFGLMSVSYIMRNAGLEEAQAGIKTAGRNSNNLRYADDTTLMAESEEELKSLLMKEKEESGKVGLKLNIEKTRIMTLVPSLHGK